MEYGKTQESAKLSRFLKYEGRSGDFLLEIGISGWRPSHLTNAGLTASLRLDTAICKMFK